MELSAAQRRIAFVLVVLALAGLGVYLFTSAGHGAAPPGAAPRRSSPPVIQPPASTPATPPASAPGTPPASATQVPDIYRWLPFTPAGLSSAAAVAVRFGAAYGTFSYTQSAAAYVATMRNLIAPQLSGQLAAAYATPGVTSLRTSRKQVSTGTASIRSLRAFGPSSLTFVLLITEQITATRGGGPVSTSYAVTLTGGDTSWQVSDIELAVAGNA